MIEFPNESNKDDRASRRKVLLAAGIAPAVLMTSCVTTAEGPVLTGTTASAMTTTSSEPGQTDRASALTVVDVQNDFCEGGSLPVTVDSHVSKTPIFVDSWPVHCTASKTGASVHPDWTWPLWRWSSPRVRTRRLTPAPKGPRWAESNPGGRGWYRHRPLRAGHRTGCRQSGTVHRVLLGMTAGMSQSTVETALVRLHTAGVGVVDDRYGDCRWFDGGHDRVRPAQRSCRPLALSGRLSLSVGV